MIEKPVSIKTYVTDKTMTDKEAFAYCRQITKGHYENFPVGSLFVPKEKRPHFYSIYAFARGADDFADEAEYEGCRMDKLNEWGEKLADCYRGRADHPIFIALARTVRSYDIPQSLFQDLLTAFKMDVTRKRYQTFDEVLFYCRHSANPVGRLILLLSGYRQEQLHALSDKICTGLQLANFWQDVSVDLIKDRVYLPRQDLDNYGYSFEQLQKHAYTDRFAELMKFQVERTRQLFEEGKPLLDFVGRDLRFELRLVWLGGTTILHKIERNRYNAFIRPKLKKWDAIRMIVSSFMFRILKP